MPEKHFRCMVAPVYNAAARTFRRPQSCGRSSSVMEETPKPRRSTYILARGRYDAPKTEDRRVSRATPAVLPKFPSSAPQDRLGLAEWLVEPNHPLTARVAVNRFWQMLFGAVSSQRRKTSACKDAAVPILNCSIGSRATL